MEQQDREKVEQLVKRYCTADGRTGELAPGYFRFLVDRAGRVGRARSAAAPVPWSLDLPDTLAEVLRRVAMLAEGGGGVLVVQAMHKGETHPADALRVELGPPDEEEEEDEKKAKKDPVGHSTAAILKEMRGYIGDLHGALSKLQGGVIDIFADNRMLTYHLEIADRISGQNAMKESVDRFASTLEKIAPAFAPAALAWATRAPDGSASGPPADPDAAADWLIEALIGAAKRLGAHLQANPGTITPARVAVLQQLVQQLAAALYAVSGGAGAQGSEPPPAAT